MYALLLVLLQALCAPSVCLSPMTILGQSPRVACLLCQHTQLNRLLLLILLSLPVSQGRKCLDDWLGTPVGILLEIVNHSAMMVLDGTRAQAGCYSYFSCKASLYCRESTYCSISVDNSIHSICAEVKTYLCQHVWLFREKVKPFDSLMYLVF